MTLNRLGAIFSRVSIFAFVYIVFVLFSSILSAAFLFLLLCIWFLIGLFCLGVPFLDEGYRQIAGDLADGTNALSEFVTPLMNAIPFVLVIAIIFFGAAFGVYLANIRYPKSKRNFIIMLIIVGILIAFCIFAYIFSQVVV